MDVAVGPRGNSFITLFEPLRLCSQPNKQRTDGGGDDVRYLQHGRHMATTKKNQLLLVSSTSRPNLLCFGFDLTQSQSSKTISRNGYGPNWNRTNFNWRDQETDMVPKRECTAHQQKLYTRCFKMRLGEKLKRGVWRRYGERQAWNRGREGKRFTFSCSPQSSCFISYSSSLFPLWESRI